MIAHEELTYRIVLCSKCYSFGIQLTASEIRQIKLQVLTASIRRKDTIISIPLDETRKPCAKCKGKGWQFVNSDETEENILPAYTVKRW